MAKFTIAYCSFVARLGEVDLLCREAAKREQADAIANRGQINAFCRAAIVLLSSHIEGYFKELGEITLDAIVNRKIARESISSRLFYHISKDLIDDIRSTQDPNACAERIFIFLNSDRYYWSRSGPFESGLPSDRFNKGFSNPAFKKVRSYMGVLGTMTLNVIFFVC